MRWKRHSLDEVCVRITDGTHHSPPIVSKGIPYVTAKHIKSDGIRFFDNPWYISPEDHAAIYSRCDPKKGDVLYIKDGATTGVAAVNEYDFPFSMLSSVALLRPHPDQCEPRYLCHWLNSPLAKEYFIGQMGGAAIKRLTLAKIKRFEIPLPPLSEQKRIAEILDRADALRAKRRAALALLDELTQSIFLDMFGDVVTNPNGWDLKKLEDVANKITDGEHLNPKFVEKGMTIIMAGDVLESGLSISAGKNVSQIDGERFRKKCNPEAGDVLLVSRGATIGRQCVVSTDKPFCLMGSVILIKLNHQVINPVFLSTFFRFGSTRASLFKTSGSSAQQAIYLKDLRNLKCFLPPIELQGKFAERVAAVSAIRSLQTHSLTQKDQLFASLQHRAFRGGL